MLRIVFAYMLALAAAQDTTTDAPDTTTDAATTTIAATTAQGNLGGVVATTTEAAADTTTAAVTTTTTTTTTTTPDIGESIALPAYTNAAVVTGTAKTSIQICVEGATLPLQSGAVDTDTNKLTEALNSYVTTDAVCAAAGSCTVVDITGPTFYCPHADDRGIQVDVTIVKVVTLLSDNMQSTIIALNLATFKTGAQDAVEASSTSIETGKAKAKTLVVVYKTDYTKKQEVTADFSYCIDGASVGGELPTDVTTLATAIDNAGTTWCTNDHANSECTVTTATALTCTDDKKSVEVKVKYTAVVTNGFLNVQNSVETFQNDRKQAIEAVEGITSATFVVGTVPWTYGDEALTYVVTAIAKSSVKACFSGVDNVATTSAAIVNAVYTDVCNAALPPGSVCSVVAGTPTHPCGESGRRGRQLLLDDQPFQADVTIVSDVTDSDHRILLTAVTTNMEDPTGLQAAVTLALVVGPITGEALQVQVLTGDDATTPSPTTSGAATMFVGHIGALLVTYLYVSL